MRTALAPYLNQYVLCKGWIGDWEDMDDCSTRRVFISQPTIRKPDRNLLFEDQERISTEHHLNLFIKYDQLKSYTLFDDFSLHTPLSFTGVVEEYQRKNGSIDYGIYPTKPSTLHYRLAYLTGVLEDLVQEDKYSEKVVIYCERVLMPQLKEMEVELEDAGNELPTFLNTYTGYKEALECWIWGVDFIAEKVSNTRNTRAFRRGKFKQKKRNDGKVKQPPRYSYGF